MGTGKAARGQAVTLAEDTRLDFTRGIADRVLRSDLGLAGPLAGAAGLLRGALGRLNEPAVQQATAW